MVSPMKFVLCDNDEMLCSMIDATIAAHGHEVVGIADTTTAGVGLVQHGKLFRGTTGTAGEIGHTTVAEDGPICRCGNRGCLELYAGGSRALATRAGPSASANACRS